MVKCLTLMVAISFVLIGLGCGGSPIGDDWDSNYTVNQATFVGSPTKPESSIKKYLSNHRVWKTSLAVEGSKFEKIFAVEFDMADLTAKILPPDDSEAIDIDLSIDDRGNLSIEGDSGYDLTSSPDDSEKYPYNIILSHKEVSGRLFAANPAVDTTENAKDSDNDLLYEGRYFVAGFYNGEKVIKHDTCSEDGMTLYEAVDNDSADEVKCSCVNGKCVDNPADIVLEAFMKTLDICDYDKTSCEHLLSQIPPAEAGQHLVYPGLQNYINYINSIPQTEQTMFYLMTPQSYGN